MDAAFDRNIVIVYPVVAHIIVVGLIDGRRHGVDRIANPIWLARSRG